MNKRGQFYLIAAMIIIFVIIGFALMKNTIRKQSIETGLYDLGEELKIETGNVYDYGIYSGGDINILIDEWANKYLEYSRDKSDIENWIFVYGDRSEVTELIFSEENTGSIGIEGGGWIGSVEIEEITKKKTKWSSPGNGEIEVKFKDFRHTFDLKQGENFFFIINSKEYTTKG